MNESSHKIKNYEQEILHYQMQLAEDKNTNRRVFCSEKPRLSLSTHLGVKSENKIKKLKMETETETKISWNRMSFLFVLKVCEVK